MRYKYSLNLLRKLELKATISSLLRYAILTDFEKENSETAGLKNTLTENIMKRTLIRYSLVVSEILVLASVFNLLGWTFGINFFLRPLAGMTIMNPVTALSWLLLGSALWVHIQKIDEAKFVFFVRALSVAGAAIGAWKIIELIIGTNSGIDHLLFPRSIDMHTDGISPRNMSPVAAFSLVMIGVSLFLSSFESERVRHIGNLIAFVVFAAGMFSIIGHVYQVKEFYGLLARLAMLPYAAAACVFISLAAMFINNDVGFMSVLTSEYRGGVLARSLAPIIFLVPLLLGFVSIIIAHQYPDMSDEWGISLLIMSIILIFFVLIWYVSAALNRSDMARTAAAEKLEKFNHELERQVKERTDEINKSEKRFRALVEKNDAIIALMDKDYKTTYRTPSSKKISGWSDNDRRVMSALALIHPDDYKSYMEDVIKRVSATPGVPIECTFRLLKNDGTFMWLQGTITNLLNDPNVNAIVTNFRDITARKLAEEEVRKLNEELELIVEERTAELKKAVDDMKSFAYTISHDLRSPLQVISTYSSVLALKQFARDDEAQNILSEIKTYTHQMSDTIESLLHLSLSSRIELVKEKVEMNKLVQKVIDELRIINKNISAEIKIEPLASSFSDEGLIKLVWHNLLSNAIKYSAKSENPVVEISSNVQQDEIIYSVKDNGIGFGKEDAEKIFGLFHRLPGTEEFEGTGLGLAIVQRIVARHGGRAWAEPNEARGAVFYFTLPREIS